MSTSTSLLNKFVAVYNDCWLKGFGYDEVARQLNISRREAVVLASAIRMAERKRKEKVSCLKGKLSNNGRISQFLEQRKQHGDQQVTKADPRSAGRGLGKVE